MPLDEAFLMTQENLPTRTPVKLTPERSSCFCREQKPDDDDNLRRQLGIESTGPVSHQEHKIFMKSLMHVSFYGIMKYCLRMRLLEKCWGFIFDKGGQGSHGYVIWLYQDINQHILRLTGIFFSGDSVLKYSTQTCFFLLFYLIFNTEDLFIASFDFYYRKLI